MRWTDLAALALANAFFAGLFTLSIARRLCPDGWAARTGARLAGWLDYPGDDGCGP